MFKVVQNPVHLVEFALFINMFYAELIAVGFAYRAVLARPTVPYMGMQIGYAIRLFLPYP